jgi:serine/threonine protein kinase
MDPTRRAFPLLKLLYSVMIASSYLVGLALLLFSAARYRLWDIDRLINRTIVYAIVTAVLVGAFVVAFFGGRVAMDAVAAPDSVAIAISLAAALALFPIVRRQSARWIDRRFYGIGLDYEALAAKAVRAAALTTTHLGAYDELALLGRGGMGAVYRAHHAQFAGPVALKVIAPALASDRDAQERFRREAQILDGLRHAHVIPFLASGHEDGLAYIAMAYVEGTDLARLLEQRGRLPLADVATIIAGIAEALDAAHALGVVHRDVKPANVLLERGEPERALLMDFGVARLAGDRVLPGDDSLVGSLPYISPEQIQHADGVDGRADIYSLGATTFELLTGRPPFREHTPLAYVMAHLRQPPPDARTFEPTIPPHVAAALARALAKAPADRYATAGELAAALRVTEPAPRTAS